MSLFPCPNCHDDGLPADELPCWKCGSYRPCKQLPLHERAPIKPTPPLPDSAPLLYYPGAQARPTLVCEGLKHRWPATKSWGDTCQCGEFYIHDLPDGGIEIEKTV